MAAPIHKPTSWEVLKKADLSDTSYELAAAYQKELDNKIEEQTKSDQKMEKWPEKCQQIYDAIRLDSNITIAKLELLLGTGHTTVKKMLTEMQNEGFIRHIGPDKGGYWKVLK